MFLCSASDDSFNDSRLTVETALKNYSLASDLQNSTLETLLNVCYTQIGTVNVMQIGTVSACYIQIDGCIYGHRF